MENKKTPKHLAGLKQIIDQQFVRQPDNDGYAKIAFTLIEIAGDKESIKEVADYIQRAHRKIKDQAEAHAKMISDIYSWMMWAEIWTLHKDDAKLNLTLDKKEKTP